MSTEQTNLRINEYPPHYITANKARLGILGIGACLIFSIYKGNYSKTVEAGIGLALLLGATYLPTVFERRNERRIQDLQKRITNAQGQLVPSLQDVAAEQAKMQGRLASLQQNVSQLRHEKDEALQRAADAEELLNKTKNQFQIDLEKLRHQLSETEQDAERRVVLLEQKLAGHQQIEPQPQPQPQPQPRFELSPITAQNREEEIVKLKEFSRNALSWSAMKFAEYTKQFQQEWYDIGERVDEVANLHTNYYQKYLDNPDNAVIVSDDSLRLIKIDMVRNAEHARNARLRAGAELEDMRVQTVQRMQNMQTHIDSVVNTIDRVTADLSLSQPIRSSEENIRYIQQYAQEWCRYLDELMDVVKRYRETTTALTKSVDTAVGAWEGTYDTFVDAWHNCRQKHYPEVNAHDGLSSIDPDDQKQPPVLETGSEHNSSVGDNTQNAEQEGIISDANSDVNNEESDLNNNNLD